MRVQFLHMVSIDVPAGVGAPPLNTTSNDTLLAGCMATAISASIIILQNRKQIYCELKLLPTLWFLTSELTLKSKHIQWQRIGTHPHIHNYELLLVTSCQGNA